MKRYFSPAIRLMNQLNYRRKFAFLGLISLMAISVLIYSLFLSLTHIVDTSQKQLLGIELTTPISAIIRHTQKSRNLSAGLNNRDISRVAEHANIQIAINTSLENLEQNLPGYLEKNNNWLRIKDNWSNLSKNSASWTISKSYAEHTRLINQLQFFKIIIADEFALNYSHASDSYYLIDTIINKLPDAMEQLAQIHAFGTNMLAKKQISEYQKREMVDSLTRLEYALHQLHLNLNKTASFNQAISTQLSKASAEIFLSTQQVIALVQSGFIGQQLDLSTEPSFTKMTDNINESYTELYQILYPTAKNLITSHLKQAQYILYVSLGLSLTLMIMVLYFFVGIYYSLNSSVQSLIYSLQQFTKGQLTERIHLNTQDELNWIGNSFNQLAERITFLLASAENSQKKIQQVLDGLLTMAGILLPDGTLDFANATPLKLAGLNKNDVLGKKLWDCHWFAYSNTAQEKIHSDCQIAAQGETINREIEFALKDSKIWVDFSVHPVFDDQGKVKFLVAEARDATRRRLAEEHSKRSQKMDALGKLVGGIAHDYNNMLGVILGYAELLEMKCENMQKEEKGIKNYINEIIRAGERGRTLTRKILGFSKPESSNPDICNVNQALQGLKDMLEKSLTASISLKYEFYEPAWNVWIDPNELEDAILNMSINAKYAMPEGGRLTITTKNIYLASKEAKLLGLTSNDYVKLSISDIGCGMDDLTITHIFDPFFTTKGDAGSGLGLSQVFGFMERSGGAITVYSELNTGTQFNLYFPRFHKDHHTHKTFDKRTAPQLTGSERILVVDDEPALRELANQILTHFGYQVLTANSGEAALNTLAAQPIDLMLSDVIMPNMDGYQLARQVSLLYPSVKIQLASGFSDNRHTGSDLYLKEKMLNKPYSSKELLSSIRILLDGSLIENISQ